MNIYGNIIYWRFIQIADMKHHEISWRCSKPLNLARPQRNKKQQMTSPAPAQMMRAKVRAKAWRILAQLFILQAMSA